MSNAPEWNQHKQDPAAFLMGGGVPSASFIEIGASVTGTICEEPTLQQQRDMTSGAPKNWDDGSPMMQLVVTLQTDEIDANIEDDDGRRRIYVKYNLKAAVADAVRKAGAKALQVGGRLTVRYVRNGEPTKRGFSPPKFYEAQYTPPAAAFLDEPDKSDDHVWTLDEAVYHAKQAGLSREAMVAELKRSGATGWNSKRDTPTVRAWIAKMRPESTITDQDVLDELSSDVPF